MEGGRYNKSEETGNQKKGKVRSEKSEETNDWVNVCGYLYV